jgi:hypothetical protein
MKMNNKTFIPFLSVFVMILIAFVFFVARPAGPKETNRFSAEFNNEVQKIESVSKSDDVDSIDTDLKNTDLNSLDNELNSIDKEIK